MRPERFVACGPHICGPYTPIGNPAQMGFFYSLMEGFRTISRLGGKFRWIYGPP